MTRQASILYIFSKIITAQGLLTLGLLRYSLGGGLLSHILICSIIGDKGLNFRVRNGTGCTPLSMATKEISNLLIKQGKGKEGTSLTIY